MIVLEIFKDLMRLYYTKKINSSNPVDILSFDNIFLERDIPQCITFKGKRSGIIHIFTMDLDPG